MPTRKQIGFPSLYFSHEREIIDRDGVLLAASDVVYPVGDERVESVSCASARSAI